MEHHFGFEIDLIYFNKSDKFLITIDWVTIFYDLWKWQLYLSYFRLENNILYLSQPLHPLLQIKLWSTLVRFDV